AVQDDGAAFRSRRRAAGAADAAGQARHRGRTGTGCALRHPQHPDAGAVPGRSRAGARVGRAAGGRNRALGTGACIMKHIVILGSGFAALTTIRRLRALGVHDAITVVSPHNELVYLPSLIWIPSGKRSGDDLRIPLARFFERNAVQWHRGSVSQVLDGGRRVITDQGELQNDVLVIATGGRYLRKLPGIEHAIIPCEGIAAAESIRDRLAAMDGGTIAIGFSSNPKEPGA